MLKKHKSNALQVQRDQQIIYNKYSSDNHKGIGKLENKLSNMSRLKKKKKKETCREIRKFDL